MLQPRDAAEVNATRTRCMETTVEPPQLSPDDDTPTLFVAAWPQPSADFAG